MNTTPNEANTDSDAATAQKITFDIVTPKTPEAESVLKNIPNANSAIEKPMQIKNGIINASCERERLDISLIEFQFKLGFLESQFRYHP